MKHRDIIRELNQERERDLITPLLLIPTILLALVLIIANLVRYADQIDYFCYHHPLFVGWSLVVLSLFGLIWLVKKITW